MNTDLNQSSSALEQGVDQAQAQAPVSPEVSREARWATCFEAADAPSADQSVSFDDIMQVVRLAHKLAKADFERHLVAVFSASDAEKPAAVAAFRLSERAAELADAAYVQVVSSEGDFRRAAVEAVSGNAEAARQAFDSSGARMESAGVKLEGVAAYIPKSAFFQAAISAVQKTEQAMTNAEAIASRNYDNIARSFTAFAGRMVDFGRRIAQVPEKAVARAREKATTVLDATIAILTDPKEGFVTAIKAFDRNFHSHSPWDTLEALDFADSHVRAATRMVGKAAAGAGKEVGTMFARMFGRLAASFEDSLTQVKAEKDISRFVRDLGKIEPIMSAAAPVERAAQFAETLTEDVDASAGDQAGFYARPRATS